MRESLFNLLGNNFMQEFLIGLRPYLIAFFVLVAAAGVGYGIYLAIWLAKAEHEEGRRKAWRRIFMALSSILIIVILTVYILSLDVGEVYDRENLAFRHAGNYELHQNVFEFEPYGRHPVNMMFRGLPLNDFYLTPSFTIPVTLGPPPVNASIELDPDLGWVFVYHSAIPPETVSIFNFSAFIQVVVAGEMITVTIPLQVQIYDPITAPTPTPARPQGPPNIPPITPPGGTPPSGNWWQVPPGGGTGVPNAPVGNHGFVPPVPLSGSQTVASVTNSQMWVNGACPCPGCNKPGMNARPANMRPHRGQDISRGFSNTGGLGLTGNVNIFAIAPGTVVGRDARFSGTGGSGLGNFVIIRHTNQINGQYVYSLYAHLERVDVAMNATVSAGQVIGIMGTTGDSSGVHLHWEIGLSPNSLSNLTGLGATTRHCPCCFF